MTVKIKWLGHSGFQIRSDDDVVYVDYYRPKKLQDRVAAPKETATAVLVTHSHEDHCHQEAIAAIAKKGTAMIGPADCAKKIGGQFAVVKPGDTVAAKKVSVRAVHAYNVKRFRSPGNPFHPKGFGVGYLITIGNHVVYHAGDTDLIPEMKELGKVDVALLPVGDTYTMDIPEALEAVKTIRPRVAIPMHTWDKSVEAFRTGLEKSPDTKVVILKEGEEFIIE